jgi:hypothetical protein
MRIEEKERPGDASMGSATNFEQFFSIIPHWNVIDSSTKS